MVRSGSAQGKLFVELWFAVQVGRRYRAIWAERKLARRSVVENCFVKLLCNGQESGVESGELPDSTEKSK